WIGGFALRQKGVQRRGVGRGRKLDAEIVRDSAYPLPTFGGPHHTPKRWKPLRVEKAGGDAVGSDHQVLDQLLGAIRRPRLDVAQPVAVEDVLDFQRLKLQ